MTPTSPKCLTGVQVLGQGSTVVGGSRPVTSGKGSLGQDDDDICRAQPLRGIEPCPRCGYVSRSRPAWADIGATFALGGARYRIVADGSTNAYSPRHLHFEDTARCQLVSDERWGLPGAPCAIGEAEAALAGLFALPTFRAFELEGAYMIEARP